MSRAAERMRRYRERQRAGQACYRVTVDDVDLEEHLIAEGYLAEHDRGDREAVERALAEMLVELTRYA